MIHSIITRIAGAGLLLFVMALSAYALLTDQRPDAITAKPNQTVSAQDISEKEMGSDETKDMPVVKLASLSIITDYPAVNDSSPIAELNMTVEERLTSAKQFASKQKFDEALRVLETTPTSDQEAYSVNYLKAQILSWSGNHSQAERAFINLRKQYPQDADIAVSFGYLQLYQNNFDDAERLFTQVLDRFPDYQDAKQGLKRARAIQ